MGKENRTISSAVRHGGKLYKAGMEDDLAKDLTAEQINRLTERGAISGFDAKADKAKDDEEAPKGKGK